jgi:hypothetical protein
VRRLRAAHAPARAAAVRALRRAHCARPGGLPRMCTSALADHRALGALARRPARAVARALEARRDLAGPVRGRARRPRAPSPAGRGARHRPGGARPAAAARRRSAGRARGGARVLVGAPGRRARAPDTRRAPAARARCERAPAQRPRRVRGAGGTALAGPDRRRLHDRRHGRRMRSRAAPSGRGAGARDHAGAHAARPDLCSRATSWQTPSYDVPERGGTRWSFR